MINILTTTIRRKEVRVEQDGSLYEIRITDDNLITSIMKAKNYKRYLSEMDEKLKWECLDTCSVQKVFGIKKAELLNKLNKDTITSLIETQYS